MNDQTGESRKRLYFDGVTFDWAKDSERLTSQLSRVYHFMLCGGWRTLGEIRALCGGSESGGSARLRDLRKDRFGKFTIERRRCTEGLDCGLWEYRMEKP